jgi:NAD(P)H dehydrogenase (quinone)
MKLAITGASGQYGHAAAELSLARVPAEDLVLLSRTPSKLAAFAELGCEVRHGDFDDPRGLAGALRDVDRLLMISTGRVGRRLEQHRAAVDAAAAAGVRHIVYTSFVGLSEANPALVAKEHLATERVLAEASLASTALRDNQYADAFTDAAGPLALRTGVWQSSTGTGRLSPVARTDCVAAAAAVMTGEGHEDRIYNITGPDRLTWREISDIIAEVASKPIDYRDVSADQMYAMFDALGVPRHAQDDALVEGFAWSSEDMVSFEAAVREGFMDVASDDVELLTGRRPASFRSFVDSKADALRAAASGAPPVAPVAAS